MKQAMIFAAGLGTRLRPLTDTRPKALVEVGGKPLLWHVLTKMKNAGFERVVVNVHHFARQIVDYLGENDFGMNISISDESSQLLETGGGIKHARPLFSDDSPVLVHNVDILSNANFEWFMRQHLPEEDAVLLVSKRQTKRYLLFDNAMRLMGWVNKETGEVKSPYEYVRRTGLSQHGEPFNEYAFSGIHSFSPSLFPLMDRFPERFSIIDFYLSTCHRSRIVGVPKADLQLLDVGKTDSLAQAENFINSQKLPNS